MPAVFESIQEQAPQNRDAGESTVITKPVSLAVGDVMVGVIVGSKSSGGSVNAFSSPSGWTNLTNLEEGAGRAVRMKIDYIVATATEVAASNFTWGTGSSGGTTAGGVIYRISSAGTVTANADGNSSADWSCTLTPEANSLLLMAIGAADSAASGSVSNYAIATSSPSWTERYDTFGNNSTNNLLVAGATGSRPESTATGNASATFTTFSAAVSIGALVAIAPAVNTGNAMFMGANW